MFLGVGNVFECWRCFSVLMDVESVFGCFLVMFFSTLPNVFPAIYPSTISGADGDFKPSHPDPRRKILNTHPRGTHCQKH